MIAALILIGGLTFTGLAATTDPWGHFRVPTLTDLRALAGIAAELSIGALILGTIWLTLVS